MNEAGFYNDFFAVIRAGLKIPGAVLSGELDGEAVLELAQKQSVLPIVKEGLHALGIKGAWVDRIDCLCVTEMKQFVRKDMALENICFCLEKNGIEYIPLKGSVLRDLYPDKWLRTSCDIDVLVKEEKLAFAVGCIEKDTDFRFDKRNAHDVCMRSPKVTLELHFNLKEGMENIDGLLLRVWEYSVPEGGTCRFSLSPEFLIFHVASHMSYHFSHGGMGIRPYFDLWFLRQKTAFDENALRKMLENCGILKFYEECAKLSEVWLGDGEHSQITSAMERFSLKGDVFGSPKNEYFSQRRANPGMAYPLRRIFISSDDLKALYPAMEKRPFLFPYYQVRRWADVLKKKRSKVGGEIRRFRKTSRKELASYDELMKSVGL